MLTVITMILTLSLLLYFAEDFVYVKLMDCVRLEHTLSTGCDCALRLVLIRKRSSTNYGWMRPSEEGSSYAITSSSSTLSLRLSLILYVHGAVKHVLHADQHRGTAL